MNYLEEQREWEKVVTEVVGRDAILLSVSTFSSDCRVYQSSCAVYKMRRLTHAARRYRPNSLEDEFLLLMLLASMPGVPVARAYRQVKDWEIVEMDPLPPLRGHDPTFGPPKETWRDFLAVARATRMINKRGCSHGDLHMRNVGRNADGGLSFFDFDQAQLAHPLRCMLRDFFGFAAGDGVSKFSLFDRASDVRLIGVFPRAMKLLKKAVAASASALLPSNGHGATADGSSLRARAALRNDASLLSIAEAWEIAARSNASAPGVNVAYYSLDVCGINFPGERPWILRWHRIKEKVEFRGKRFLELGCNMGLLSIHAKMSGAAFCTAVDLDHDILKAANLAAKGFGCDVAFRQLDLNAIDQSGIQPEEFDIVSALSVMHWVQNKDRLWAFLGHFPELLYEGHESEPEAVEALKRIGFNTVLRLGPTERSRQLFWARRESTNP